LIGYPAPRHEESELVIMIAVRDRRDAWVEPKCRPEEIRGEPWLELQLFNESEMALFHECTS